LRTQDPILAKLDDMLVPWRAKRGAVHASDDATAELVTCLDYQEVCDTLLR
jgi:hypothetical protein